MRHHDNSGYYGLVLLIFAMAVSSMHDDRIRDRVDYSVNYTNEGSPAYIYVDENGKSNIVQKVEKRGDGRYILKVRYYSDRLGDFCDREIWFDEDDIPMETITDEDGNVVPYEEAENYITEVKLAQESEDLTSEIPR